ncbi:SRPBCC domain-containing protein [Tenacibaculum sp. 1_MG-2023]|uniref:SRPBCC family protein n=1 Tax=Tenacibaculum sp. 1_MG-2023 TaxID=3062653 RepID=UPI0026E34CF4|nr:SRPBCC domain-containing protein [Tenacibaculum sp. 1_MG-2023]MDO6675469.1 SRPBCC domain-containing protein [Tenacibaculum sp. 1_MG-2023]
MEQKTKVVAETGKQEIVITRIFDLPIEHLFMAYVEPEIIEQWMGTKVLKLECKRYGSYEFETTEPKGNKHLLRGVIHEFIPQKKIIRTFEMNSMPFGVQLEVFTFKKLTDSKSKLIKKVIYQSVKYRDENLKLPFKMGINWAHQRLEEVVSKLLKV